MSNTDKLLMQRCKNEGEVASEVTFWPQLAKRSRAASSVSSHVKMILHNANMNHIRPDQEMCNLTYYISRDMISKNSGE